MTQQTASMAAAPFAAKSTAPASLKRMLVALDASAYADRALAEAVTLAGTADGVITGIHAYAAQLHDRRFRQMEGGLPERYKEEREMEHQREVHDDLITRGLNIISDSYHDVAHKICRDAGLPFRRLSPEGKNYSCVVEAAGSGDFGVLVLGALGLGAVQGSTIGTVCERVVRRSPIDVLVIKDAKRAIGDGPIVVGLDGSLRSFGALMTALDIGRRLAVPVHAVAAYDPYYHYVAFNKIAGVLSDEAGKIFRFKEQEKLHEELIDEGIAKIYQSHLDVAVEIAGEEGAEITCELLDGKPFIAIRDYLRKVGASLLLLGKTGIHADADLDIGGNAENLLRVAPCHVWIGQVEFEPPLDVVAQETIAWSDEAEALLARAPDFVQGMARKAILRSALKKGHSFITAGFVEEAASRLMPGGASGEAETPSLTWAEEASALLAAIEDESLAENIRLRAEKHAIQDGATCVEAAHVRHFLEADGGDSPVVNWNADALARLSRVPEPMRQGTRERIEAAARRQGASDVTMEIVESGLEEARRAMRHAIGKAADQAAEDMNGSSADSRGKSCCPFANLEPMPEGREEGCSLEQPAIEWTAEAKKRMKRIPDGFMREMTLKRVEAFARRHGTTTITEDLVREKYAEWAKGSARQETSLDWEETALKRINRIPGFVRGMVILEVERCARDSGRDAVTNSVIDQASGHWRESGVFHSHHGSGPDE